jgi:hypothetical protein
MDLKHPPGAVKKGTLDNGGSPDCILTLTDEDMTEMVAKCFSEHIYHAYLSLIVSLFL